jgi:HEAT repeat protein
MALKDVFKRKTPLEKAAKDLREPYAQPDVRQAAMTKLLEMANPEAYDALLMRFSFNANGHIADEDEKRELVTELVRAGKPVIEPIKRFVKKEKAIGFPLTILSKILTRAEYLGWLKEALTSLEPLDHRTTEQKRAMIASAGELGTPAEAEMLTPFLGDHHDDVQAETIDALERLKSEPTYGALIEVCVGDTHSARIQRRAAQALENLAVTVKDHFERFSAEIKNDYLIGKKGVLAKKGAAKPASSEG